MVVGLTDAQLQERVMRLEDQLRAVYDRLGMPYDDGTIGIDSDIVELARAGNRMRAAQLYSERTGCDFREAQVVVNRI